jgi:uncharacterized protein YqgV (UPF0045/DUF77 family)
MNTSVEISYYPLDKSYIQPIQNFIDRLNMYKNLVVKTSSMSTHLFGDYFDVMKALTIEIYKSFELPASVFVIKIINADLNK